MLEIEKWAQDKPPMVQFCTLQLASFAGDIFEILFSIKHSSETEYILSATTDDFQFYTQPFHEQVKVVTDCLENVSDHGKTLAHTARHAIDRSLSKPPAACHPLPSITLEEYNRQQIVEIEQDINPPTYTTEEKEYIRDNILVPEFSFFTRVVIPCFYFYQENYSDLFLKAEDGNLSALDKLLRLDKSLIQHPDINKWIYHYSCKSDKTIFHQLVNALKNPPQGKVSPKTIKYKISGFIWWLTEQFGHKLTTPDIQDLFNSIAIDYGRDDLLDTDLPDSPESFLKAVQREKENWHKYFISISPQPPSKPTND